MNRRSKKINADQGQIRLGRLRFLHKPDNATITVDFRDAEAGGVFHLLQQDRCSRRRFFEFLAVRSDSRANQVVAEVHDEGIRAQERLRNPDGMSKSQGLGLKNVVDFHAPRLAGAYGFTNGVAGLGRDDDAHFFNSGIHEIVEHMEQYRSVAYWDELLGGSVRKRPQSGSPAAAQDQSFEFSLHFSRLKQIERILKNCLPQGSSKRSTAPGMLPPSLHGAGLNAKLLEPVGLAQIVRRLHFADVS